MNWSEEYKKKLVSAEEAVKIVNSNDRVVIPLTQQPALLPVALAARRLIRWVIPDAYVLNRWRIALGPHALVPVRIDWLCLTCPVESADLVTGQCPVDGAQIIA